MAPERRQRDAIGWDQEGLPVGPQALRLERGSATRKATVISVSVQDVMTSNVIAVATSMSFKDMAGMFGIHRQDMFPVLDDDGTVIGVVSEADLLGKQALDGRVPGPAGGARRAGSRSRRPGSPRLT